MKQTNLFKEIEIPTMETPANMVVGGIYVEKSEDPYDPETEFGVCFGTDALYFLFDGISLIDNEVEVACLYRHKLVPGYALAFNRVERKWYVRNSGIKHQPHYILKSGNYIGEFTESLKPYLKLFIK